MAFIRLKEIYVPSCEELSTKPKDIVPNIYTFICDIGGTSFFGRGITRQAAINAIHNTIRRELNNKLGVVFVEYPCNIVDESTITKLINEYEDRMNTKPHKIVIDDTLFDLFRKYLEFKSEDGCMTYSFFGIKTMKRSEWLRSLHNQYTD